MANRLELSEEIVGVVELVEFLLDLNLNVLLKRFDCFCNVVLGLDIVFQRFARVVQRNASDRKQEHKVLIDVTAREILED